MSWQNPDWNKTVDGAQQAASALGAYIASAKAWPDVWAREWAEDVAQARTQIDAERSGVGAVVGWAEAEWAEALWKTLAQGVLLDMAPERGLGPAPAGWADGYLVCLEACGAVRSRAEAEQALGLVAQVAGTATMSAADVKAAGAVAGEAAKAAASFFQTTGGKVLLGLGAAAFIAWLMGRDK